MKYRPFLPPLHRAEIGVVKEYPEKFVWYFSSNPEEKCFVRSIELISLLLDIDQKLFTKWLEEIYIWDQQFNPEKITDVMYLGSDENLRQYLEVWASYLEQPQPSTVDPGKYSISLPYKSELCFSHLKEREITVENFDSGSECAIISVDKQTVLPDFVRIFEKCK